MRLETEARCQQQVHYLTINLSFTAENQDLREAIDFGRLDADHFVITAPSIADWVTTIYIHSMKPIS